MLITFIGRFQIPHFGHQYIFDHALKTGNPVLVLVGSANRSRSVRDPFTVQERIEMLRSIYPSPQIEFIPLPDAMYNDNLWLSHVQSRVAAAQIRHCQDKVSLIGHSKDQSSYYLNLFPGWQSIPLPNFEGINSTALRKIYFSELPFSEKNNVLKTLVAPPVLAYLEKFENSPAYQYLLEEFKYVTDYKKMFEGGPHPVQHNTCDAICVQSGHVLLTRRNIMPGKGLWALPGTFIKPHETALDASIRVLRDTFRLKVPEPVLRGSMTGVHHFDDVNRSDRGRIFTVTHRFELRAMGELPKVKSTEDKEVNFMQLGLIKPEEMFEDHYFQLSKMLGVF